MAVLVNFNFIGRVDGRVAGSATGYDDEMPLIGRENNVLNVTKKFNLSCDQLILL
jgi:hypothetical protein